MAGDGDVAESLFETMMARAVAPFPIALAVGGEVEEWEIAAVDPDGVGDLDSPASAAEHLQGLLGDVGEEVLEVLDELPRQHTFDLLAQVRAHFALSQDMDGRWVDLVDQIDCYGDELDWELFDRGWDLLDFFRGRHPWPQLLGWMARFPPGSRFVAAIQDDEELARIRLQSGQGSRRKGEASLVGETQMIALQREILNAIRNLGWRVVAVQQPRGKQGTPPKAMKGPRTAEDRVRERDTLDKMRAVADIATPGWRDDGVLDQLPADDPG